MKFSILTIFVLSALLSQSQSKRFFFKLGTEYELPRKSDDVSFVGNSDDGSINLTLRRGELTILRFDPQQLTQTSDKVIELPEHTKAFNSETVARLEKNYY